MPPRRPPLPAFVLAAYSVVLGMAMVLSGRMPSRAEYDHKLYHEPTIRQFAAQWPDFDLWHYKSATTPGYHILQAAVVKFISPSLLALQITGVLIGAALSFLLARGLSRHFPPPLAIAFALPLASSTYIAQSSAYLLPDNLGWLGVLAVMLLALRDRFTFGVLVSSGLILLGLVMVRQIHAWTAGLVWLAAWLNGPGVRGTPLLPRTALFADLGLQIRRAAAALAVTLPAILLLGLFYRYWGGLVPPVFQGWYHSGNPAAPVFVLAVFGVFAPFFVLEWWPGLRALWTGQRWVLAALLAATALLGVLVPTTYDVSAGRFSGAWGLAARTPAIGHTSPLIVALALLGTASLLGLAVLNEPRRRLILLGAVLGYSAACAANHDVFQRYIEPFALLVLALLSAGSGVEPRPRRAFGPTFLAAGFVLLTATTLAKSSARIDAPPPAASAPGAPPTPAELPRPPMPPGKRFL